VITKSGFVAIVGRPNVGKSTLLNALVGQKVAIVANRPQTTRNRILGIVNEREAQMLFLDTPGLHKPKDKLGAYMMRQAEGAVRDVDAAVLVVEPTETVEEVELGVIERAKTDGFPVILAVNKIDAVEKSALLPVIAAYAKVFEFAAIIPISARTGDGLAELKDEISKLLPEGPAYFPEDAYTDQTERQMVAELIREKALRMLDKEVPHGLAVDIERFVEREDGIVEIKAVIVCEKESHKGIIIGKGGTMLKKIGSSARVDMERLLGCKVYLETFVKVRELWRDNERLLRSVGYNDNHN
jgi:GTP-binding protein Era